MNYYGQADFSAIMYCGFLADPEFMRLYEASKDKMALPIECAWPLYRAAQHCLNVDGDFVEFGVDRGGSAKIIASLPKTLHLFDTFSGMPDADASIDYHKKGDFPAPDFEETKAYIGGGVFHRGRIPESFRGVNLRIAFAHVDLDLYQSTLDACEYLYPRMTRGAIAVFDDYGRPTCQGVRRALDEFFADKKEVTIPSFLSGQMFLVKL